MKVLFALCVLLLLCQTAQEKKKQDDWQRTISSIRARSFEQNLPMLAESEGDLKLMVHMSGLTSHPYGYDYVKAVLSDPRVRDMCDELDVSTPLQRKNRIKQVILEFHRQLDRLKQERSSAAEKGFPCQSSASHSLGCLLFLIEEYAEEVEFEYSLCNWYLFELEFREQHPKIFSMSFSGLYFYNLYAMKLEKKAGRPKVEEFFGLVQKEHTGRTGVSSEFVIEDISWLNCIQEGDKENRDFLHLQLIGPADELLLPLDDVNSVNKIQQIREQVFPEAKNFEGESDSLRKWIELLQSKSDSRGPVG